MTRATIITMGVELTTLSGATNRVFTLAEQGKGAYVCVSNVHMCMEVFDSTDFTFSAKSAALPASKCRPVTPS